MSAAEPRLDLVAHIREQIERQGAEDYVAKRLPYVVDRIAEAPPWDEPEQGNTPCRSCRERFCVGGGDDE